MLAQSWAVVHSRVTAMTAAKIATIVFLTSVGITLLLSLAVPSLIAPWGHSTAHNYSYRFRTVMYRSSFVSCLVVSIMWATTTSVQISIGVKRIIAQLPNDYARYSAGGVSILLVYYLIPNFIVQLYVAVVCPLAGGLWLVFQAFVLLAQTNKAHNSIVAKIVEATSSDNSNVQLFYLNNKTTNSNVAALTTVRLSRWLLALYVIIFCCICVLPISMWISNVFPSSASGWIIGATVVLGLVCTCASLTREVNRGLLVPAIFLLYATALCLQILSLDPGNPHNITTNSSNEQTNSSGVGVVFVRYSALLQSYTYISDVILGIVYLISAHYSATNLASLRFSNARGIISRIRHTLCKVSLARVVCRCFMKYDKEGNSSAEISNDTEETSKIEEHIGDDGLLIAEQEQHGSVYIQNNDNLLPVTQLEDTTSLVPQRSPSNFAVSLSVGELTEKAPTKEQMSAFYARLLLLVAYTPLLLTRWGSADGAPAYSAGDVHLLSSVINAVGGSVRIRDDIAHQYYLLVLLVIVWAVVWVVYCVSLYNVYAVNSQYLQARRRLYLRDLRVEAVLPSVEADTLDVIV